MHSMLLLPFYVYFVEHAKLFSLW